MKRLFKNPIFVFLLGIIVAESINVIADTLSASEIDYRDTKVDQALDTLYQRSNYTEYDGSVVVTPSEVQQTLETNDKLLKSNITIQAIPTSYLEEAASLQAQLDSLSVVTKTLTFTTSTTAQTINLGFKPDSIYCISKYNSNGGNGMILAAYNKSYDASNVVRAIEQTSGKSIGKVALSSYYTINNNGFSWNVASTGTNGSTVYCTASKYE